MVFSKESDSQSIKLTKLDTAKSQLETAILLFFQGGDPVSIHSLVSAALSILRDIARKKGIGDADPYSYIHNEKLKNKIVRLLNQPQNFFKHADKDTEEMLEFNPKLTIYSIIQANGLYTKLKADINPLMCLYNFWFYAEHKDELGEMLLEAGVVQEIKKLVENLNSRDRKSFLKLLPYFENVQLEK